MKFVKKVLENFENFVFDFLYKPLTVTEVQALRDGNSGHLSGPLCSQDWTSVTVHSFEAPSTVLCQLLSGRGSL